MRGGIDLCSNKPLRIENQLKELEDKQGSVWNFRKNLKNKGEEVALQLFRFLSLYMTWLLSGYVNYYDKVSINEAVINISCIDDFIDRACGWLCHILSLCRKRGAAKIENVSNFDKVPKNQKNQ